ncbi:hypothetical protein FB561_4564 [Kribbella amoyensis]|uniref:Uncharacterized protein n=1 Tax=Kribbella amoyensis TaxID=996641 RepID=A0A561BXF2_9ACTN|nr:hypothetical protein [Kribbella amoyensis]TWD83402.1 hypothetical protein FB561_4564 [Kribbella amoyensis]
MVALTVTSDNPLVEEAFSWARKRALGWVQTDVAKGNLPSYWAGYPSRDMFYSRDVCHQAVGAHLLGLDAENFAMLRHFARSATAARKWYPLWAFHFDGTPAALDYRGDDDFVREIPAVFDLTWRSLEQYAWTGDRAWIDDPDLAAYYRRSVEDFVAGHDGDGDGIPEASGTGDIFVGTATYNEHSEAPLTVASDGLALHYAALLAVARLHGDSYREQAERIQRRYLDGWWSESLGRFARGRSVSGELDFAWGLEASWIAPMTGLTGDGPRTEAYLDFVEQQLELAPPANIEAFSYLPEVFFRHRRDESAWRWLRHLIDSRDDYPEISFTVVQHLVAGLLGLRPDAATATLTIDSHLPAAVGRLTADHVRVGAWDLRISQTGRHTTELTVHSGPGPLTVRVGTAGRTTLTPGETARVTSQTKDPS